MTAVKVTVKNVAVGKQVRNVRFRVMHKKELVRVTTNGKVPLFVERLGPGKFLAAPAKELPVVGATPAEAFEKGVKRFWAH